MEPLAMGLDLGPSAVKAVLLAAAWLAGPGQQERRENIVNRFV